MTGQADGVTNTGSAVWAAAVPRVVPAVLGARPPVADEAGPAQPPPVTTAPPRPAPRSAVASRPRFRLPVSVGQIACWQLALTLAGVTIGRPLPLPFAVPAVAFATVLLALTVVRVRNRWLYQWAQHHARFRRREHRWHLPREDGPRAVLHLFAPDAMLASIRLGDSETGGETAVVNRICGATTVLRPVCGGDPIEALPRPGALLTDMPSVLVQLVMHGVAGDRRRPLAWLAVQAVRTPDLSDEDDLNRMLDTAVRRVLSELAERDLRAVGLGRAALLRTFTSLAHVGEDRRDVRERWRRWHCGPVAQVAYRLTGWTTLPDQAFRQLLARLLTEATEAVVTVSVAGGGVVAESVTVRIAASNVKQLKWSVKRLGAVAAEWGVRLDRMDGEHADGVAAVLPLGAVR